LAQEVFLPGENAIVREPLPALQIYLHHIMNKQDTDAMPKMKKTDPTGDRSSCRHEDLGVLALNWNPRIGDVTGKFIERPEPSRNPPLMIFGQALCPVIF